MKPYWPANLFLIGFFDGAARVSLRNSDWRLEVLGLNDCSFALLLLGPSSWRFSVRFLFGVVARRPAGWPVSISPVEVGFSWSLECASSLWIHELLTLPKIEGTWSAAKRICVSSHVMVDIDDWPDIVGIQKPADLEPGQPSLHLIVGGAAEAFEWVLLTEIHGILQFRGFWRFELVAADECSELIFINICTLRLLRTLLLGWLW